MKMARASFSDNCSRSVTNLPRGLSCKVLELSMATFCVLSCEIISKEQIELFARYVDEMPAAERSKLEIFESARYVVMCVGVL